MAENTHDAMYAAVSAAKSELAEIVAQIEAMNPLLARKALLESFIATGERLLVVPNPQATLPGTSTAKVRPQRIPLWQRIFDAIHERTVPMSAKEVLEILVGRNVAVNGDFPAETVRGAMLGKPKIFEKQKDGKFLVRPIGQTAPLEGLATREAVQ